MVVKNVKVTPETHEQLSDVASLLNKSNSEVISMALSLLMPNLEEEKKRRQQMADEIKTRLEHSQN